MLPKLHIHLAYCHMYCLKLSLWCCGGHYPRALVMCLSVGGYDATWIPVKSVGTRWAPLMDGVGSQFSLCFIMYSLIVLVSTSLPKTEVPEYLLSSLRVRLLTSSAHRYVHETGVCFFDWIWAGLGCWNWMRSWTETGSWIWTRNWTKDWTWDRLGTLCLCYRWSMLCSNVGSDMPALSRLCLLSPDIRSGCQPWDHRSPSCALPVLFSRSHGRGGAWFLWW